ncbi:MAG: helix-turn-helix domain-containing protein [Candidatus Contendobacter sp.]|jgi:transcriptional regulator with XRE-family HTH domain|nr:helix-turn-helix domain-containing protein [Candidatus Contendobacter sp.]
METRGTIIRRAREALKLSQDAVAETAKISQQAYSDIENDRTLQPRRSALKAIAKMLQLPEDALILNKPGHRWMSKEAQMIAEEYDTIPPAYQAKILLALLEAKKALR